MNVCSSSGYNITDDVRPVRSLVGYMPDFFGLYEDMKVWEYLDFFASAYRVPRARRTVLIDEVLELTDQFYNEFKLTVMMVTHDMKMALAHGNRILMMDKGEIIMEAEGSEKNNMTIDTLVKRFHDIRGQSLSNDETLLSV